MQPNSRFLQNQGGHFILSKLVTEFFCYIKTKSLASLPVQCPSVSIKVLMHSACFFVLLVKFSLRLTFFAGKGPFITWNGHLISR